MTVRDAANRTAARKVAISEDIAAPGAFEVEERLDDALDIPVFHDDQHGTAIVTLAALDNALRIVGKRHSDVKVVVALTSSTMTATAKSRELPVTTQILG